MMFSIIDKSRRYPIHVFLFLLLGTLFCEPVIAAESGRVKLNGREVILFDDNTWKFSDTNASIPDRGCVLIKSTTLPVTICLDDKVWKNGNRNDAAELSFVTKDEKLFLLVITETDEVKLDAFEKAIVVNAQSTAGKKSVDVKSKERLDAHGLEWGRMVYDSDIDNLKVRHENYFTTIKGKGSVQFVFYTTPDQYTAASIQIGKAAGKIGLAQ